MEKEQRTTGYGKKRKKVARFESFLIIKLGRSEQYKISTHNQIVFSLPCKRTELGNNDKLWGWKWMNESDLSDCLQITADRQYNEKSCRVLLEMVVVEWNCDSVTVTAFCTRFDGGGNWKKDGKKQDTGKRHKSTSLGNKYHRTRAHDRLADSHSSAAVVSKSSRLNRTKRKKGDTINALTLDKTGE